MTMNDSWGYQAADDDWKSPKQVVRNLITCSHDTGNYLINYHASSDTFDKVDLEQLKKQVAEAAVLTFALANNPEHVGPRLTRAQIEQTLRDTHLDRQMKILGMWKDWETGKRGRTIKLTIVD